MDKRVNTNASGGFAMKRIVFLCFLSILLLLLTCGKSTEPDQGHLFLFSVKVIDTAGTAVPDLNVGSINHSDYLNYLKKPGPAPKACPVTYIYFSLPVASHVTLEILNYYGQHVVWLLDSEKVEAGTISLGWDGTDEDGTPVISGFYRYRLSTWSNDTLTFSDEKWMLLELGPDPTQTIVGNTDSNGVFATDDTLLFPCLLGAPPRLFLPDDTGYFAVYDFYKDTVTITLSDPAEPDKFIYFIRGLRVGPNSFKLVWDPTQAQ
jgi:hypothetical protein